MVKVKGGKSSERSVNVSKGIILGFFTIYLIIFGIVISVFISSYHESHPGELRTFMPYLPLLCYLGAVFIGISLITFLRNTRMQKTREVKSRKKIKAGSIYKQALFLLIFIFSFIPLLAPIIDQGKNDQNFSVYNEDWRGSSDFKELIDDEGYDTLCIQSSLSATKRLDKKICLILLGTNQFYNPFNEIPYFMEFLEDGNSLLICHDYGSTSNLLYEIFLANMINPDIQDKIPITFFPDGVLRDNESFDTNPEFPVIETFTDHPIAHGIGKVILSECTAAVGGPFLEYSGWDVVGYPSLLYSFVDMNDDGEFDYDDDSIDLEFVADAIGEDFPEGLSKIPLISPLLSVFMAKDTGDARIVVSSDASLFNNELLNEDGYDNQQFALNIIKWLTRGEDDWIIVFDEAHIRPEKSRDVSSPGIFGFIIQYVVQLSTNPLTAWIYPLLAVYTLKRYLPKKDEKEEKKKAAEEEKKEELARFRTSSFFAKKIEWYRDKSKYDKALTLLYRRLERKLNAQLGGNQITTKNVVNLVKDKEPRIPRHKIRRITRFMDTILAIKGGKKVRDEKSFEELFFEMEWIVQNI